MTKRTKVRTRYGRQYIPKADPPNLTEAQELERRCPMCGFVARSWLARALHLVEEHGWRFRNALALLLLAAVVACSSSPVEPEPEPAADTLSCGFFECWPNDPHPIDTIDIGDLLPDSVCVAWRFGPHGSGPSDVPRCARWKARP